jgi:hypothetical protein
MSLIDDNYREILAHVQDIVTLRAWFLTCKLFQRLVTAAHVRTCTRVTLLTRRAFYDGPINGVAEYAGERYVYWRHDRRQLLFHEWPPNIWSPIEVEDDDHDYSILCTRKYTITSTKRPEQRIAVYKNAHYRLYRSATTGIEQVKFGSWHANHFDECVPYEFYSEDCIRNY